MSSLFRKKNQISMILTRIKPFLYHEPHGVEGSRLFSSIVEGNKKSPFTALTLVQSYQLPIASARSLLEKVGMNQPKKYESDLHLFFGLNKSSREDKMNIYKKWGWNNKKIDYIMKKHPGVLLLPEQKIMNTMNFLVSKMGCKAVDIVKYPAVLHYSLEERIVPRCLVYKVLASKGLLSKQYSLFVMLKCSGDEFEERYVTRYKKEVPRLLDLYLGKMTSSEV